MKLIAVHEDRPCRSKACLPLPQHPSYDLMTETANCYFVKQAHSQFQASSYEPSILNTFTISYCKDILRRPNKPEMKYMISIE